MCTHTQQYPIVYMHIHTIRYCSAIKMNDFMKFLGKWLELESVILSEVTQSQMSIHGMHSLIGGW